MSNASGVTFQIKEVKTFPLKVELAIPPEKPIMQGVITVDYFLMNKDEIKKLSEEELQDAEYFDRVVSGVKGLADVNGNLLEGEAAIREVRDGKFNLYFLNAIITTYFEQYGEARRKNSKSSSRR